MDNKVSMCRLIFSDLTLRRRRRRRERRKFGLMGICLSARIKAESPWNTGGSSKYASGDGNDSSTSSKISSFSVPPTPRSEGWIDEHSFAATKPGTGMVIAVKRLNQESSQGHKEWLAEVNYLGQLYHPHLVKLIGYCLEDEHRLLVYEFMPRGSLENHLFRRGSYFQPLSWNLRLKAALGAAKGLAFLHSAETKVIYRDFKTSNILLDSSYNAKLSDFGLAKDGPTGDKSHVSTRVMGTYGYAAPEYLATGHLSAKSDVYSFGVVMLEMLSGRRAVDKNRPSGEHNLVEWAKPYLANKRKIFRIIDNRLEGQYSLEGAHKLHNSNETGNSNSNLNNRPRARRHSADNEKSRSATAAGDAKIRSAASADETKIRSVSSYPRPSDSPLYA
ncbi:hypothetical protein Q3G72_026489 [Acer saccharum]|nr:hypothetical protein Q3G72_026489 [Acer saccharum]